jgi:NTE family protein
MQHEQSVLVLQGGGALGAYQAGAYEALSKAGHEPFWVAGISIGAINAALITGNVPGQRVARLRQFWETVSSGLQGAALIPGDEARSGFNAYSSWLATVQGIPGFFSPRLVPPAFALPGSAAALSYYDTTPLHNTLTELVDFDLLNSDVTRTSVGAVNVRTGNFRYFDSQTDRITTKHVMASGALPPGFPPVEIDGDHFWDGGLVSNTPLQYVLDQPEHIKPLCIFQIDVFPSKADMPKNILDVAERAKEIQYSSRTRLNTNVAQANLHLRKAARRLLEKLPQELRDDPDAIALASDHTPMGHTLVHLIKRPTGHDNHSKDYDFSRLTIAESWEEGVRDVEKTLSHPAWRNRNRNPAAMLTFDLTNGTAAGT